VLVEVPLFPLSKIGVNMFKTEEIHIAGFLSRRLKSNFVDFFSALDNPGAERKINPKRTTRAATLKMGFLCIGASFLKFRHALQNDQGKEK
jgi:hypothetical protein